MIRSDGTVGVHGEALYAPQPEDQLAVITGGTNPYLARKLKTLVQEVTDPLSFEHDSLQVDEAALFWETTWSLWERNGNRNVLPGTVVVAKYRYQRGLGDDFDREWVFDFTDHPIDAQITTDGAPATTLVGSISALAVSLTVASTVLFPGRNFFRIRIDDEVLEVIAGAGTTTWTVQRGVDGTDPAPHAAGSVVVLAGQFAWTEQEAPQTGNDLWEDRGAPRTGTFLLEPARERNHNTHVPNGTYVQLWRKSTDGAGATTLTAAVNRTQTTWLVASSATFPKTPFVARVGGEYVHVVAVSGPGWSVVRGRYLSPAMQHEAGSAVVEAIAEWVFEYCCREQFCITTPACDLVSGVEYLPVQTGACTALEFVVPFWAELVSGTNPYAWREMEKQPGGAWVIKADGRTGTIADFPAYEVNENEAVPTVQSTGTVGTIVQLWWGYQCTEYLFEYCCGDTAGSGSRVSGSRPSGSLSSGSVVSGSSGPSGSASGPMEGSGDLLVGSESGSGLGMVSTICCPSGLPQRLFALLDTETGCFCLDGETVPLDWVPADMLWRGFLIVEDIGQMGGGDCEVLVNPVLLTLEFFCTLAEGETEYNFFLRLIVACVPTGVDATYAASNVDCVNRIFVFDTINNSQLCCNPAPSGLAVITVTA